MTPIINNYEALKFATSYIREAYKVLSAQRSALRQIRGPITTLSIRRGCFCHG